MERKTLTKVIQLTGGEKKKKNVNVDKLIAHMITNGREKSRHFVIYFHVFKNVKKYKAIE